MSSENEEMDECKNLTDDDVFEGKGGDEEENDSISVDTKVNKNEDKFHLGNGNLHFLPAKFNFSKSAKVDVYFETNIEKVNGKMSCKHYLLI